MPSALNCNPWLSIWTKPRDTILEIAHKNPTYRFFFFCFIYGFVALLQSAQRTAIGHTASAGIIILTAAVLGFFIGYASLSITSLLLTWTGKWIGGKAGYYEVRTAVAWSNVPVVIDLILWLTLAAAFGPLLFTEDFAKVVHFQTAEGAMLLFPNPGLLIFIGIVRLVLSVWSIVIFLAGLSAVQGFSVLKAVLNAIFSIVIAVAVVWIGIMAILWLQKLIQT